LPAVSGDLFIAGGTPTSNEQGQGGGCAAGGEGHSQTQQRSRELVSPLGYAVQVVCLPVGHSQSLHELRIVPAQSSPSSPQDEAAKALTTAIAKQAAIKRKRIGKAPPGGAFYAAKSRI
jgi:hypothetical protein